jgi:hypothetical protein
MLQQTEQVGFWSVHADATQHSCAGKWLIANEGRTLSTTFNIGIYAHGREHQRKWKQVFLCCISDVCSLRPVPPSHPLTRCRHGKHVGHVQASGPCLWPLGRPLLFSSPHSPSGQQATAPRGPRRGHRVLSTGRTGTLVWRDS